MSGVATKLKVVQISVTSERPEPGGLHNVGRRVREEARIEVAVSETSHPAAKLPHVLNSIMA
jgi:hypothetical protein